MMISEEEYNQLRKQNELLMQQVQILTATVKELNQTIVELREQLNKNSHNSSKPPSSDGYKKPKPKSLRTPSGKKQGGQTGHKGTHLEASAKPDEIIPCMPTSCKGCPYHDICKQSAVVVEKRQVFDAIVKVMVREFQCLEIPVCMLHGDDRKGTFPEDVKAAVQYGKNLEALVVALNTMGAVSIQRTHEILSGVFGIPLATGTISNMVSRCAEHLTQTVGQIRDKVINSALVHFDETGTRVDKKLMWVHDASNCSYTYLDISPKRGVIGMEQCGVLPDFKGIAVHDCWAPYWKYPDVTHSVCCAHLLRELIGVTENYPEQKWAANFRDLLLEMKKIRDKSVDGGKENLSYYYLHKFDKLYDEYIQQGRIENPLPEKAPNQKRRKKKGKVRALIERLANYKASVCLFMKDFRVPFDNNQAERDLRMVKVKTKVSGCFRVEEGARDYLKIMSYVGTAHKQGLNAYEALRMAISGHPEVIWG